MLPRSGAWGAGGRIPRVIRSPVTQPCHRLGHPADAFPHPPEGPPPMVLTQDFTHLLSSPSALPAFDVMPAGVVAVVLVAFAVALVTVSVRRRDAE
jgi:hypothetical protein